MPLRACGLRSPSLAFEVRAGAQVLRNVLRTQWRAREGRKPVSQLGRGRGGRSRQSLSWEREARGRQQKSPSISHLEQGMEGVMPSVPILELTDSRSSVVRQVSAREKLSKVSARALRSASSLPRAVVLTSCQWTDAIGWGVAR
jgi:hypothetical protein